MTILVLTGASGSGKTTLARALAERFPADILVFHFDQIGVPPLERMVAEHGSPESWQRAATIEWMKRLADLDEQGRDVVFEGQTRLSFLAEGTEIAGGLSYVPILIDCDDETRKERLSLGRGQPELANPDMMNWAEYLRGEARRSGCEILDTSGRDPEECVAVLLRYLSRWQVVVGNEVLKESIQRADAADAITIRDLTRAAYAKWIPLIGREPLPMAADYDRAVRQHLIDLLYVGDKLAALIEMIPDEEYLLIENVAVSPSLQGRGYGRRLMKHAEQVAGALHLPEIRLYTNQLFAENIALYGRLGYIIDREEPFRGGVVVHMSKRLPDA